MRPLTLDELLAQMEDLAARNLKEAKSLDASDSYSGHAWGSSHAYADMAAKLRRTLRSMA